MLKKVLIIFLTIALLFSSISNTFAEKVYTNDVLEKYKSKKDKQMTEEQKIKESERREKAKKETIEVEEKMWRNANPKDKTKSILIEKE